MAIGSRPGFPAESPGAGALDVDATRAGEDPGALRELRRRTLDAVVALYPDELRAPELGEVRRYLFQLEQVHRPGATLVDLGGGIGAFAPTCARLGMTTWLVDDFGEPVNRRFSLDEIGVHRQTGVRVLATPVRDFGRSFTDASVDVVTCFDSLEHWHHSPRPVLEQARRTLRPGGLLFLSTPNAANAFHRLRLLLGRANGARFEDWYYPEEFRGHVREPVVADLQRMVADLGLELRALWGRNWPGVPSGWKRPVVTAADRMLRPFPTLCKDLYVLAAKPGPREG
jgi:2-polyprenyl-3-methyl-5-hydroxy-6-metoxy-1,4-benzoquinol methylase